MNKAQYARKRNFTPNSKVVIMFQHFVMDNKVYGKFNFFLANKFILSIHSEEYAWLQDVEGILTKEQYLEILDKTAGEKVLKQLNQIINSLNILAKYDAN